MQTDKATATETGFFSILYREFFLNSGDGMVIAFSVATGLQAATGGAGKTVAIGAVVLAAAAVILGVGAYLAGKIEIRHFYTELQPAYQQLEDEKEVKLLDNIGLGAEFQNMALGEIAKDRLQWEELLQKLEATGLPPDLKAPAKRGFLAGVSFLIGGLLPLIPYLLNASAPLPYSIILTLCGLGITGYMKNKLVGGTLIGGMISAVFTGALAGLGAFYVAELFL